MKYDEKEMETMKVYERITDLIGGTPPRFTVSWNISIRQEVLRTELQER